MKHDFMKSLHTIELIPLSGSEGQTALGGSLPACGWKLGTEYYRHLESLLRRRCAAIRESAKLQVHTTLYSPSETLCSVRVQAELLSVGRQLPFLDDGCVWDLRTGFLCGAERFLGRRCSRKALLRKLEPRREPEWMLRSCPDWETRVCKSISALNFCLEPEGLRFLLPPMALGPILESSCKLSLPGK